VPREGSINPESATSGRRDHGLVPGRIPDDLDVGFCHTGQPQDLLLGIAGNDAPHTAAGGGEGHLDRDAMIAVLGRFQGEVIDEAEVDDVDRDFGIEAGPQCVPNLLLQIIARSGRCLLCRGLCVLDGEAEGIGVLALDSEQAVHGPDGEGASEVLSDIDLRALRQGGGMAGRDLDGGTIALELDGTDFVHGGTVTHEFRW
jgi:hypothetical protein